MSSINKRPTGAGQAGAVSALVSNKSIRNRYMLLSKLLVLAAIVVTAVRVIPI